MGPGNPGKRDALKAHPAPLFGRLLSAWNVQPGEGARVAWMMLYSVAAIGGFLTIGLAAASALFLSELPAAATPFVFISSGASSVIVFLLYSLAMSRLPQDGLVLVSDVLLLAIALILRLLLGTRYGQSFPVLLALFLFVDAGATLVITQFWVRAAQIFNPREAKRLFGLISAAGTASAILASLRASIVGRRRWRRESAPGRCCGSGCLHSLLSCSCSGPAGVACACSHCSRSPSIDEGGTTVIPPGPGCHPAHASATGYCGAHRSDRAVDQHRGLSVLPRSPGPLCRAKPGDGEVPRSIRGGDRRHRTVRAALPQQSSPAPPWRFRRAVFSPWRWRQEQDWD